MGLAGLPLTDASTLIRRENKFVVVDSENGLTTEMLVERILTRLVLFVLFSVVTHWIKTITVGTNCSTTLQ